MPCSVDDGTLPQTDGGLWVERVRARERVHARSGEEGGPEEDSLDITVIFTSFQTCEPFSIKPEALLTFLSSLMTKESLTFADP